MKKVIIISFLILPSLGFSLEAQVAQLNTAFHGVKAEGGDSAFLSSLISPRPEAPVPGFSVKALNSASIKPAKPAPVSRPHVDEETVGSSLGIALGLGLIAIGAVFGGWWVAAIFVGVLMAAVSAWLLAKSL